MPDFQLKDVKNQILTAICVTCLSTSLGSFLAWTAPIAPLLQSDQTPLHTGPISANQMGILGFIFGISSTFGTIVMVFIRKIFGIKMAIVLSQCFSIVSWLIILFVRQIEYIYLMRCLSGLFVGSAVYAFPAYMAEISDDGIRGRLGSLLGLSNYIGIFMAMTTGAYLPYGQNALIHLAVTIVFGIWLYLIPHTPQFLLQKGRLEDVENSILFYKNCDKNSDRFKDQLEKLKTFVDNEKLMESLKPQDLCDKEVQKSIFHILIIPSLQNSTGIVAMMAYAASIFENSGSNIDSKMAPIIVSLMQIVGLFCALPLIDKIGRRSLLILGCLGAAIGTGSLGLYNYLAVQGVDVNVVKWIPILSLSILVLSVSIGISPATFVILLEIFPQKLRNTGYLLSITVGGAFFALSMTIVPILIDIFNLYVCMWMFSCYGIFGMLFVICFVQDTTGKDLLKT